MSDQPDYPDPTEIRHVIGAAGSFSLHNISGDITLRGVDGDEVVVRARSERGRGDWLPLVVRRGEGSLSIEIEQRGPLLFGLGWRHVPGIEFDVTLPRGARVDVNAVSSDVDARGLTGEQEFRTVSGDLDLNAEGGRVTITTVSGDARLVAAEPIEPRVSTTSGDVEILAPLIRALTVRTVSGDAELRAAFDAGAYHNVETVSGDVSINAQAGLTVEVKRGIDLSGNGGRQRVVGDGAARLRFRSLSGDLELTGERPQASGRPMPPAPPEAPRPPRPTQPNSLEILQALERGEIDVEEAARRLEGAGSHG
jgi:hypothetical protein